jgi:hypothetical protein
LNPESRTTSQDLVFFIVLLINFLQEEFISESPLFFSNNLSFILAKISISNMYFKPFLVIILAQNNSIHLTTFLSLFEKK